MKQQSKKKSISSLDNEKSLREQNLALFYEIQVLRARGDHPEVLEKIEEKERQLKKSSELYFQKYEMLYELDKQEEELKKKKKMPLALKILLGSAGAMAGILLGVVLFGRAMQGPQSDEDSIPTYVFWEDMDDARDAASKGLLIATNDYMPVVQYQTSFMKLGRDTRVPDLDSVKDEDLVSVRRYFKWEASDGKTEVHYTPSIYRGIYKAYRSAARYLDSDDFHCYIDDETNSEYIKEIASKLNSIGNGINYTKWDIAKEAIHFVQIIPYCSDSESTGKQEWPKYVIETLYDACGDCEDKSFLLAALLDELGYDAVLLVFDSHMAVGVAGGENCKGFYLTYRGKDYYYIDPCSPGWTIGQVPTALAEQDCVVVEINK